MQLLSSHYRIHPGVMGVRGYDKHAIVNILMLSGTVTLPYVSLMSTRGVLPGQELLGHGCACILPQLILLHSFTEWLQLGFYTQISKGKRKANG